MHTQCSENKQTVSVKVKFYCIYIISNVVCTCVPSLGLLAPAFQEKQAKTHKKSKNGKLGLYRFGALAIAVQSLTLSAHAQRVTVVVESVCLSVPPNIT